MNQNNYSAGAISESSGRSFDVKAFFFKYLPYWPFFLLSVLLSLTVAYFSNRYATPIYSINSTLLLKDAKGASTPNDFLQGLQSFKVAQNLQNEIGILSSRSMAEATLKKLDFSISYFSDGNVKNTEIFNDIPIRVDIDSTHTQLWGQLFELTILNSQQFEIGLEKEKNIFGSFSASNSFLPFQSGKFNFGEYIEGGGYRFKIEKTNFFDQRKKGLQFKLNSLESLVNNYAGRVRVAPISKASSIVSLTLDSSIPSKDISYLNKFSETYINMGLMEKNLIARNTINFINEQLNGVSDSLDSVEDRLQQFRTANRSIDLTEAGTQVFQKLSALESRMEVQRLKLKYYSYLLEYISKNRDLKEIVAPSVLEIEDNVTTNLVGKLIELYAQRNSIAYTATDENPYIPELDSRIKALTQTLEENVRNAIKSVQLEAGEINNRVRIAEGDLSRLPKTERALVSIKRKFSLNENLYVYLLQKRAEAGIAKASNLPDSRIIDEARVASLIYPKPSRNYTMALVIGFLIPIGLLFAKEYLNDTITSREELERLTKIPILGVVMHNRKPTNLVISSNPKSAVSETFRSLRSNLQYIASDLDRKVILITSGISGEGKTFCAINLATVLALSGKKTLLVGVDLRKPRIFNDFGLSNEVGLSTYLIGQANKQQVIQPTHIDDLDVITAGPLAPNPTELLMTKRFGDFVKELKSEYENIVFDSPPLGLVADSFELLKYTDVTLYVVRQNYTSKGILSTINNLYSKGNISNVSIVLNDFSGQNTYGYGYGYGYGYYDDDENQLPFWQKLAKWLTYKRETKEASRQV
jgi:tyrosine-protein kinase Etk/Wzc